MKTKNKYLKAVLDQFSLTKHKLRIKKKDTVKTQNQGTYRDKNIRYKWKN